MTQPIKQIVEEGFYEKVDKEIVKILEYYGYETALMRNRPPEMYDKHPYPELLTTTNNLKAIFTSSLTKLIESEIEWCEAEKERIKAIPKGDPEYDEKWEIHYGGAREALSDIITHLKEQIK